MKESISVNTIANLFIAKGHGRARVQLGFGFTLVIKDAINQPDAKRNLLALKDIRRNEMHTSYSIQELVILVATTMC